MEDTEFRRMTLACLSLVIEPLDSGVDPGFLEEVGIDVLDLNVIKELLNDITHPVGACHHVESWVTFILQGIHETS